MQFSCSFLSAPIFISHKLSGHICIYRFWLSRKGIFLEYQTSTPLNDNATLCVYSYVKIINIHCSKKKKSNLALVVMMIDQIFYSFSPSSHVLLTSVAAYIGERRRENEWN